MLQPISKVRDVFLDKTFMSKAISIAIPIAVQGLLNNVLNLVDTLMIGKLSVTTIAAVGLANKVFFVFSLLLFGIVSGSGILTAQYWGKRDIPNIRRVLGLSLILGIVASLIFLIPAIINPKIIMRIFTPNQETIKQGAIYLSIVALSYPLTAVTNAYVALLRGVNQVKIPVIISIVAIMVNVVLNYAFIFGRLGAPELGVAGAAIATVIARAVETVSLLIIIYAQNGPAAAKLKELVSVNKEFIKRYAATVSPVIANEFVWGLGVTIYALVYGRMGDESMAAITISQTVEQVFIVIFQGISAATAVILGNELGGNNLKRAERYAKNFILLQLVFSIVMMAVIYLLRWPVVRIYDVTAQVHQYSALCLVVFVLYLPFKMFNYVNIVGILRSGGDTTASLVLDTTGVWLIGIPLAFLGGMVLKLPIYYVYAMVLGEEIYKFILGLIRYKQKKWLRNIVATEFNH